MTELDAAKVDDAGMLEDDGTDELWTTDEELDPYCGIPAEDDDCINELVLEIKEDAELDPYCGIDEAGEDEGGMLDADDENGRDEEIEIVLDPYCGMAEEEDEAPTDDVDPYCGDPAEDDDTMREELWLAALEEPGMEEL